MRLLLSSAVVIAIFFASSATATDDTVCPPDSFVSYDNFGAPFFSTWCTGCHSRDVQDRQGAPRGINFDSQRQIRALRDRIREQALVKKEMPPSGGPDAEELGYLSEWLACRAP